MKNLVIKRSLALVTAVFIVCVLPGITKAYAADDTVGVSIETVRYDAAAQQVLDIVNEKRSENGLRPLTLDSTLQDDAMIRAAEAAVYFSHTRPNGLGCWTAGSGTMVGENLAVGQTNPKMVVEAWMNSDAHRANLLNSGYSSVGIGCVKYNGIWFWSQAFARTEGDGETSNINGKFEVEVPVLEGLITPVWLGEKVIDLQADSNSVKLQAQIGCKNPGWEYVFWSIDPSKFQFQSSNTRVLKIDANGKMTPASAGYAVVTASLKSNRNVKVEQEVRVAYTLNEEDVSLSKDSFVYDGAEKKPQVTIEGVSEENYVVSYKDNVKVGTGTVVITGVGDVAGEIEVEFEITHDRPDRVLLKSPTTGKTHYVKARWYKEDCDGYQIRYATNSSFKSAKSIYVKDGDVASKMIKKLKKGKRYYVKVRAYNLYEGKRVYGAWSKYKSVVCK